MKTERLSPHQKKIIDAMAKVNENLIAFKKRMDSPLVVSRDGKIMHIKPWLDDNKVSK
jgi:predicted transcriptional regulator